MKTPAQGLDGDLPMEKFADPAGVFCKRRQKYPATQIGL
jgi:hypothetical protein